MLNLTHTHTHTHTQYVKLKVNVTIWEFLSQTFRDEFKNLYLTNLYNLNLKKKKSTKNNNKR